MKQLYIIGGIVLVLIGLLFVLARLPTWLASESAIESGSESSEPTEPPPEPTAEELAAFESTLNANNPDDLLNNPESLAMDTETAASEGNTMVTLKTNRGDIVLELFTEQMPITAGNFINLAREDFYDGVKFHRVIDGFMIQGGDPLTKDDSQQGRWGTGGPGYAIEDEHVVAPNLSNVRGTISMANSGPNSGGSQFFINLADNSNLDFDKKPLISKHPVFGRVVSGMDVVNTIAQVETGSRDVPLEPVVIEDVVVQ